MPTIIAVSVFVLAVAGMVGCAVWYRRRRHRRSGDGRRRQQAGIESAESGRVKGAPWPKGWRGIPKSGDGDRRAASTSNGGLPQ